DPGDTASADYRVDLDEPIVGMGGLYFTNTVEAPWYGDVYPDDNSDTVAAYSGDLKWFVRVNQSHNWVGGETEPGSTVVATVWRDGLPIMADRTETGDGTWWQIDFCCDDERQLQIGDVVEVESSLGLFASAEIIPMTGSVDAVNDTASGQFGLVEGADIRVEVWQEDGPSVDTQTLADGSFHVNLAPYDLLPGHMVFLSYVQPDGHQVGIIRHALRLDVDTGRGQVNGRTAPETSVTVTIDGGETATTTSDGEGQFDVRFDGGIAVSDTVEAWAGNQYTSLVVAPVEATIDSATDTVYGYGPPSTQDRDNINVGVSHDWQWTRTDSTTGYFEVTYDRDITPDDRLEVEYSYPEGHQTRYGFGPSDVQVDKWAPIYNVSPGDEFTYRIRFYNNWSGTATNVQIVDTLPEHVTYVSHPGDLDPEYDPGTHTLTWDIGTLGGGSERTIELHLQLLDDGLLDGRLTNYVEISADNDRDQGNNTSQSDADIRPPGADFWVDKELLPGGAIPDGLITYRVSFGNRGNRPGVGAVLSDTLPAGTAFESSTYTTCEEIISESVVDGQVEWGLATLQPGEEEGCEFEFSLRIDESTEPGTFLTNEITISEDTGEWADNRDNRRLHNTVVEEPAADLWVDKVIEGDLSDMESEIVYRITFRNDGNTTAQGVSLTDTLPPEIVHRWHSAGSAVTGADGTITWDMGTVPAGAGGELLIGTQLASPVSAGTVMTNVIEGTTTTFDMDLSNNVAEAVLGPPVAIAVPWVGDDPHRVWDGLETTLKGVAKGYGLTHYEWDFGDGSPVESGWIDDPYAIEARHTYTGPVGSVYTATLTVWGAYGWSDSDTYHVRIFNRIHGVEKDVAIDEGLWYQHKAAQRYRSGGLPFAVWANEWEGNPVGVNATALQAFQIHGHLPGGDPLEDPYVEDVRSGWNALLMYAVLDPASSQSAGDPDSNGNDVGIGIYEDYNHSIYEAGLAMMALASTGTPDRVARTGPVPYVRGQTYYTIVQDMADWFAWGQNDADPGGDTDWARGGWRYQPNSGDSDNSNTQFPVLGLAAAEDNWGITVPQFVKDELLVWLAYSQNPNGAFGYSGPWGILNVSKTGAGIMDLVWAGLPVTDTRVISAMQYIEDHWDDSPDPEGYVGNVGDFYAMYAVKKGSQIAGIVNYGSHYWDLEYTTYLVDVQQPDGRFDEDRTLGFWFGDWQPMSTSWALLILSEGLYEALPVAIISPYQATGAT
ncbi:MAG: hypothetical protein PVG71_12695, partial [Anaerolineae bacterium]